MILGPATSKPRAGIEVRGGRPIALRWCGAKVLVAAWAAGMAKTKTIRRDAKESFALSLRRARGGDALEQCVVGLEYFSGTQGPPDHKKAMKWLALAAEQGHPSGQFGVASLYQLGLGVRRNDRRAVEWFRRAAEQGEPQAQDSLAVAYEKGSGIAKDPEMALAWYRKAAEQGNAHAQYALGQRYAEGNGVPKDSAQAVGWYRKAACQGNVDAQFDLGHAYYTGEGVPRDFAEAWAWYQRAAKQGDEFAKQVLSEMRGRVFGVTPPRQGRRAGRL